MNPLTTSAAIAALALALPLSAAAATTPNAAPIAITFADAQPQVSGADINVPGQVRVEFRNLSIVPATRVTFDVDADGRAVSRIEDVGVFSKGATIDHVFPSAVGFTHLTVSVAAVEFADGSVWQNDDVAPQPRRQAVSQLDLR
jgi:hypothetical protein